MAAWNLTRQGVDVLLLDAGEKFDRATFWTHVTPWEARARRARGEQPPPFQLDTKEQPYLTPEGKRLRADSRVGPRRQDQHLGTRQPALQRDGLPRRRARRLGHPLADPLQRRRAVLRQGRSADRRVRWRRRLRLAAGQQVLPAAADDALRRGGAVARGPAAEDAVRAHPPRGEDGGAQRLPGVPSLRAVRARLRHGVVLLLGRPSAARRAEDRQARDPLQRRRRPRARGRQGPREGRAVLRSEDRAGTPGARQGRGDGRELRRHHAHPAQLDVSGSTRTASATAAT